MRIGQHASSHELENRRVLVFGGSGFLGRHVIAQINAAGGEALNFDRRTASEVQALARTIEGEVSDSALVAQAARGCTDAVYLAGYALPGMSATAISDVVMTDLVAAVRAAEICAAENLDRFVFASSGGAVYGRPPAAGGALREDMPTMPISTYGVTKLATEHYLRMLARSSAMKTIVLRIANPYGEGQRATRGQGLVAAAFERAKENAPITIWGDGSVERDFIYVRDVARAFVRALVFAGNEQTFNIGSGQSNSVNAVLNLIETAIGKPIERRYELGRPIDVSRNVLCIEKAQRHLSWSPTTGLDEGISLTAKWWGLVPVAE